MHGTYARIAAAAVVAFACAFAAGCGQAGQPSPASAHTADAVSTSSGSANSDWAQRASTICENALPDDGHQLVNHFDARHIKRHGMAIVDAGSKLDALGAPPGGDAGAYGRMLELYKRSAIYHGLALRDLAKGNDGNAAAEYAIGLDLANKADGLAMGFGAESCDRFGMGG